MLGCPYYNISIWLKMGKLLSQVVSLQLRLIELVQTLSLVEINLIPGLVQLNEGSIC